MADSQQPIRILPARPVSPVQAFDPAPDEKYIWLIRLLATGDFQLQEVSFKRAPPYAVLSYQRQPEGAVDRSQLSFAMMRSGCERPRMSVTHRFDKFEFYTRRAASLGLEYCWFDMCCIDDSSAARIDEAACDEFTRLQSATECFVHLADVPSSRAGGQWEAEFRRSSYFRSLESLQVVLAASAVEFFSAEGHLLGNKKTLETLLHETMGVPRQALRGAEMCTFSVDERMGWAVSKTAGPNEEDQAYAMQGLLGVTDMVVRQYQEGWGNAWIRVGRAAREQQPLVDDNYFKKLYRDALNRGEAWGATMPQRRKFRSLMQRMLGMIAVRHSQRGLGLDSFVKLLGHLQAHPSRLRQMLRSVPSVVDIESEFDGSICFFIPLRDEVVFAGPGTKKTSAHLDMAQGCVQLMLSSVGQAISDLEKAIALPDGSNEQELIGKHIPPELLYACRYWVHHSLLHHENCGTRSKNLRKMIGQFVEKHWACWEKAMEMTGHGSEIPGVQAKFSIYNDPSFTLAFAQEPGPLNL